MKVETILNECTNNRMYIIISGFYEILFKESKNTDFKRDIFFFKHFHLLYKQNFGFDCWCVKCEGLNI